MRHRRRVPASKHTWSCNHKAVRYQSSAKQYRSRHFVSDKTHPGESDKSKEQTSAICSPEEQQEMARGWEVPGSSLFSCRPCRFFCSPSLPTQGLGSAEVFAEGRLSKQHDPSFSLDRGMPSVFLHKQQKDVCGDTCCQQHSFGQGKKRSVRPPSHLPFKISRLCLPATSLPPKIPTNTSQI